MPAKIKCQQKEEVWENLGQGKKNQIEECRTSDGPRLKHHGIVLGFGGAHRIFRKATGIINCGLKKAVQKNTFDVSTGRKKVKVWGDSCLIVQNAIWARLGKKVLCLKNKFASRKDKVNMQVCLLFTSLANPASAGIRKVVSSVCSSILVESQGPDPDHHSNHEDVEYSTRDGTEGLTQK